MNGIRLLPLMRELFSRYPEYREHAPWELAWLLFALNFTDDLVSEDVIAAAAEVVAMDWDPDRGAA